MMRIHKISLGFPLYFTLSLAILLLPLRFLFAWFIAALMHELGHIVASYLLGVNIRSVRVGVCGAKIEIAPTRMIDEFLCTVSGPLIGCLLILFGKYIPYIAFCAIMQTVYNILPLPGNDGEKILNCLLSLLLPRYAAKITICIRVIFILAICWFGAHYFRIGLFAPVIFGTVIMKCVKIPCKQDEQIVQ